MRAWLRRNLGFVLFALGLGVVITVLVFFLLMWVLPLPRGGT